MSWFGLSLVQRCGTDCVDRAITNSSPYNVPAGHSINVEKLVQHYQEKNYAEEEEKLRLFKEGNLPIQIKERERMDRGRASAQSTGIAEVGGKGA